MKTFTLAQVYYCACKIQNYHCMFIPVTTINMFLHKIKENL